MELLSHGLLPGTVQVPPSGQPIVQLAVANTCGGYPKMGVVVAEDLWRIAQLSPGGRLRFRDASGEREAPGVAEQEALEARARRLCPG